MTKKLAIAAVCVLVLAAGAAAQYVPWLYWTFLPKAQMDEIVGEASGESAWNTVAEINAFNRQRFGDEFTGNFLETRVVVRKLREYGLEGVEVVTFPGGPAWVAVKGELWETKPERQKIASINDMLPMLASGSATADVTAELVWVGRGSAKEIADAAVEGKIAVTEGSLMMVYAAVVSKGALGVVAISNSRPYFDPLQMPWAGIASRRRPGGPQAQPASRDRPPRPRRPRSSTAAGLRLPAARPRGRHPEAPAAGQREDHRRGPRSSRSRSRPTSRTSSAASRAPTRPPARSSSRPTSSRACRSRAPTTISPAAPAILEVARVLQTLIAEGRLPRPKRTIRFIWGPEFSGIGEWVRPTRRSWTGPSATSTWTWSANGCPRTSPSSA